MSGVWVTFSLYHVPMGLQFMEVTPFSDEFLARKHANTTGLRVMFVPFGVSFDEALAQEVESRR